MAESKSKEETTKVRVTEDVEQTPKEAKNQEAVAPRVVEGRRDGNGALIV